MTLKDNTLDEKIDEVLRKLEFEARLAAYGPGYTKLKERPASTDEARQQIHQLITDEVLGVLEEVKGESGKIDLESYESIARAIPLSAIEAERKRLEGEK